MDPQRGAPAIAAGFGSNDFGCGLSPQERFELKGQKAVDESSNEDRAFPARELMLVALRVMGLWFIFGGICLIPMAVSTFFWGRQGPMTAGGHLWLSLSGVIPVAVRLVVGILVVVCSGWIVSRFYPPPTADSGEIRFGKVGAGDLFRIACFVLGIYVMLQAVPSAIRLADELMASGPHTGGRVVQDAVHTGIYLVSGLILVFGAKGIARWMASLRYDAETGPRQQISLLFLMGVVLLIAIVLGLMRSVFR